jgi:hypothetical protein
MERVRVFIPVARRWTLHRASYKPRAWETGAARLCQAGDRCFGGLRANGARGSDSGGTPPLEARAI